jgi:hypothetical protein
VVEAHPDLARGAGLRHLHRVGKINS